MLLTVIPLLASGQNSAHKAKEPVDANTLAKLKSLVVSNPNDLAAHKKFIKYIGLESPELASQYEVWVKQFPKSAIVPFALGEAYTDVESPKAKPWLLKAVEIDPKFAKAFSELWIDGERWGDFNGAREYLKRAMEAEPSNPDYAFYYRSSFKQSDPNLYRKGMLEMPRLFPKSERGAQSLYWLGLYVKDPKEKEAIYTQLKNSYPPEKSGWSSSGMSDFFYFYLQQNLEKALNLAQSLAASQNDDKKSWISRANLAKELITVKTLMDENRAKEALTVIEACKQERGSGAADMISLLKAEINDAAGNTEIAYNQLVKFYAKTPGDNIRDALVKYGNKLGKSEAGLNADIWKIRDSIAVPATPFSLEQYLKPGKASLTDFKGKVILLTYWFPGCGPCRGEFPNFENVIRKFGKDKVAYIGINIAPEQDEYVVPFIKSSGYSFTPLKDEEDKRGNLTAPGAPSNYLIDKEGRIIFKNFRIDGNNERMLELMINELLNK